MTRRTRKRKEEEDKFVGYSWEYNTDDEKNDQYTSEDERIDEARRNTEFKQMQRMREREAERRAEEARLAKEKEEREAPERARIQECERKARMYKNIVSNLSSNREQVNDALVQLSKLAHESRWTRYYKDLAEIRAFWLTPFHAISSLFN
jgi:hypothetical protein